MSKEIFGIKLGGKTVLLRVDTESKCLEYSLDGDVWITVSGTLATSSAAGLMSAADKTKLDGLGAEATTSIAGLMSAADKTKLNNLLAGYKGYFATAASLSAAHPTGADGDFASIGATDTLWAWDSDTSAWVNTDSNTINSTWDSIAGKPTFAAVATSGNYSDLSDKPSIPSKAVQHYTGTVADDGTLTLDDGVAVSSLAIGDLVRITEANAALGIAAGDTYRKNSASTTVNVPDPTRLNVAGAYSGSGMYIHWNPYTLQGGTGSSRTWMSSNNTFYVGYRQIGGYNEWQIYWLSTVYASAIDDGSHDPWDPSLTWIDTGAAGSTNIHVEEGTREETVTNNIAQFKKVMDAASIQAVAETVVGNAVLADLADVDALSGLAADDMLIYDATAAKFVKITLANLKTKLNALP